MSDRSSEYKDVRWQQVRLEVFERDKWVCVKCKVKRNESQLHAHHTKYRKGKPVWASPIDEVVTLCEDYHDLVTLLKSDIGAMLHDDKIYCAFLRFAELASLQFNYLRTAEIEHNLFGLDSVAANLVDCYRTLDQLNKDVLDAKSSREDGRQNKEEACHTST